MAEDKEKQLAAVKMSNPFQEGIDDAMKRIDSLPVEGTLVSAIPEAMWDSWDASDEDALVADDTAEYSEDCPPLAA